MAPIDFHRLSLLPYHYPKDFISMEVADLELGQIVFAETLQDGEYSGRVQVSRKLNGKKRLFVDN